MADIGRLTRLARPQKIDNAVRRRWFESRVRAFEEQAPESLELVGTEYGGYPLPRGLDVTGWSCWCVGAGGDISFDVALLDRGAARVRSFEPNSSFEAEGRREAAGRAGWSWHTMAITQVDGPLAMHVAEDPSHGALSAADLQRQARTVTVPGRSIASLMAEWDEGRIDLLKLDLEGIEFDLIPTLDLRGLGVRILAIEVHHTRSVRDARRLFETIEAQGFRRLGQRRVANQWCWARREP